MKITEPKSGVYQSKIALFSLVWLYGLNVWNRNKRSVHCIPVYHQWRLRKTDLLSFPVIVPPGEPVTVMPG